MTWIDDMAANRKMDKTAAEKAGNDIVANTVEICRKAGIPVETIKDWQGQLEKNGWIDYKEHNNDRIIETALHSPGTDLQKDVLATEQWPQVLPWVVREGRYNWGHAKEKEGLTTNAVGKFLGWRMEKDRPVVRVGWYSSKDSNIELHDLTWQALQQYFKEHGNYGASSIDWDPNDKTGPGPAIVCNDLDCTKIHKHFGVLGASWVGDNPACPGAKVEYASDAKGLDVETKPNDERPPKEWFDRCLASVRENGNATDPERLCGWIWYHGGGNSKSVEPGFKVTIPDTTDILNTPKSNTPTSKSNTPKRDEAVSNVAKSVALGQLEVRQAAEKCGFCLERVEGFMAAGKSFDEALAHLTDHLKAIYMADTPAAPVKPAEIPKPETKADPPVQPQAPAAPATMDAAAMAEELAKMKGDIEEMKAQMEMMGEESKSLADELGYESYEPEIVEKIDEKTGEKLEGYMQGGVFHPIRGSPDYEPAMVDEGGGVGAGRGGYARGGYAYTRHRAGGRTRAATRRLRKKKSLDPAPAAPTPAAAVEVKTKDLVTVPTVGMEPVTTGTTPAAQPAGMTQDQIIEIANQTGGWDRLARMN